MRATDCRTNDLNNPMGIGDPHPRLSWKDTDGIRQTAYEVRTEKNGMPDWNSGKVETASIACIYDGSLSSRDRVQWRVRLYDENGNAGEWSEWNYFEMGLLQPEDWTAKWIVGQGTDKEERLPADCFRKCFPVNRKVERARLYITPCGVYEACLNGQKVGRAVLTPGCTEYEKRLQVQTWDVTSLMQEENTLDVTVGDSWYKGKLGCDGEEYFFGQQTKLLAQLELSFADGSRQVLGTDESFLWSNDGPVGYNDLKDGIQLDLNRVPSFSGHAQRAESSFPLVCQEGPYITEHEAFVPQVLRTPSGRTVLDFGQNIAGYVRFNRKGLPGQHISLRLGETLDNGEFTQENFTTLPQRGKSIDQKIEVICDGEHAPVFPVFFYAGFRYALVEGMDQVEPEDFTAVAIYSDLAFTCQFTCSNEKVNQFVRNTVWSEKSNFVDIPTDCPQRERAGWTGDAQVFARTATYLADTAPFFRKWLRDVRDCQREDGRVDNICPKEQRPTSQDFLNGSVGWADAAVIIPYTLWKTYGNERFITENLPLMLAWREYVMHAAADKSIYQMPDAHPMKAAMGPYLLGDTPYAKYIVESGFHWGEWSEPAGVLDHDIITEMTRPKQEENAAYMHYSMGMLSEMLDAVSRHEEAALCREYADGAKEAYLYHFVKDNDIDSQRQCKLVRPLAMGLLDGEAEKNVAARLNETCVQRKYRIGTGFLSTPFILPVLAEHGYVETAYRMLENEVEPGWLAMVRQGATTVWESYNGYDENGHPFKTSFNHYSPGAVVSFLFSHVAGIQIMGERRFRIRPFPGGSLTKAEVFWDSPYGSVKAAWTLESGIFRFTTEIPSNCEAEIVLSDGFHQVGPGTYHWCLCEEEVRNA